MTSFHFDDALKTSISGHLARFDVRRHADPGSLKRAAVAIAVVFYTPSIVQTIATGIANALGVH